MDSSINWFQQEQEGPAKDLWLRLWQTQVELDNMHIKDPLFDNDLEAFNNSINNPQQHLINGSIMGKSEQSGTTVFRRRKDNRASIRGLNRHPEMLNEHGGCPWQRDDFHYEMDIQGLHHEIEHFYEYMSPTKTEHRVRGDVIKRIENIIVAMWPETQVQVFGSYRTRLYLPTSDIDLVVIGKWSHLPLRTLEREFLEKDIADEGGIKVLDKASVPIVKLTDKRTDVKVDISFNMCNGVRSADLIQSYLTKYPVLPKLVYVLKHFLLERDLNEVFTGGISSYSLILMCISFLQLHRRSLETTRGDVNLGVLLIEFLELYGRKFNYMHTGIRIKDGGRYINKEEMQKDMLDGHRPSLLCIEDPLLSSNDIGRSSYGVLQVKRAFDYAYSILTTALHRHSVSNFGLPVANANRASSLLGRILLVTDEVVRYRRWVEEKFSEPTAPFMENLGNVRMSRSHSSGSTSSDSGTGSESTGSPTRETSPNNNCNNRTAMYNNRAHRHNDTNAISSNLTTGNTVNYYQQQQLQQQQKLNQTHSGNNAQPYNTHTTATVTTSTTTASSNNGTNTYHHHQHHHGNSGYAHHPGTNSYTQQQQRPSGQAPSAPKYNVSARRAFPSKYGRGGGGMGGQYGAYSNHHQHQRSGAASATQVAPPSAMVSPHSGGGQLTYQSPLIPPTGAGVNASLQCNSTGSHMGSGGATVVPSASMSKPKKHHHPHNVDGSTTAAATTAPVTSNGTTTGGSSASTHHNHQQIEVE